MKMNGREVFKFAARVLVESAEKVLENSGVVGDVDDARVPHQANVRIIEHARKSSAFPKSALWSTSTGTATRRPARSRSRSPMQRLTGGCGRESSC